MPIITYEQVKPYIDRIRNGDFYALTSQMPRALAVTSGTTAEPKFIPLTENAVKNQKRGGRVWNISLIKEKDCLNKILVLSGGPRKKHLEHLPIQSYTELIKQNQPRYVQKRMVFPRDAESVTDFEHRLLIAAQQAFIRQPTSLVSVNPLTILRLLELTDENRAEIGRATIKGKYIGTDIDIGKIKNQGEILANIFSKSPLHSLEFIGTWLGGTQNLFVERLKNKGLDIPMRDLGYLATEGRFTIPIKDNTSAGILNPFGNFYEFMTLGKQDLVPLQELEQGQEYNILITSENGLYRYNIQDVVQMQGWYNSTPIISFRRKDACFSSLIGEKLHENNVIELLSKLGTEKGFLKAQTNPAHYELILPDSYDKKEVMTPDTIDSLLQKLNPEYHAKRENNRLKGLELIYLNKQKFNRLDREVNPNQDYHRFKRKYLIPHKNEN